MLVTSPRGARRMRTRSLILPAFALVFAACSDAVGPDVADGTLIVANASNGWIDVDIDGRRRFNGLSMGGLSYGLSVPKGLHVVRVSNGGVFPSAIEVPVDVDLDVPLTLIAYPTYPIGSSPGISAAMLADTGAWVPGGKSKLRVVHLATTTGDMQIWRRQPDAPAGNPIMTPLAYGAASQYLQSD